MPILKPGYLIGYRDGPRFFVAEVKGMEGGNIVCIAQGPSAGLLCRLPLAEVLPPF